jgi:hypothetical protein
MKSKTGLRVFNPFERICRQCHTQGNKKGTNVGFKLTDDVILMS